MNPWIMPTVESMVLLVALALCCRVALKRPVRREIQAHPGIAAAAFLATLGSVAALIWLGTHWPFVRSAVVVAIGLMSVLALVRARAVYGSRRGLPPGSLGLATSLDAIDDPSFYARAAERWGPVFKMSQIHRPVVCVTDLTLGLEFIHENDAMLEQSDWSFNRLVPGGYLEYMNGAAHAKHRAILAPTFTREAIEASRAAMRDTAVEQLRRMASEGGDEGTHPEPHLLPIAQVGLLRVVLGVDPSHERFDRLSEYFTDLNRPIELFLPAPRSSKESFTWLAAEVARIGEEYSRGEGTDAPSVLRDLIRADPSVLNNETVVGNVVLMIKEGSIMVRGMLRWVVKMIADHPDRVREMRMVASDPEQLNALATSFVMETIRLYESPYIYRSAVQDVQLGPYRVPAGWLVRLCLTEAHSDPGATSTRAPFAPQRFSGTDAGREQFCPFGHGRHECLGADVAVEIAKTVVLEAALAYDMRAVQDGPAWRINRHWGLWRPSRQLRVAFRNVQS